MNDETSDSEPYSKGLRDSDGKDDENFDGYVDGVFSDIGIPCIHVVSSILDRREKPEDYLHRYFSLDIFKLTYAGTISIMAGVETLNTTPYPQPLPPAYKAQPGRPKKKRKREKGEKAASSVKCPRTSNGIKCSRCGQKEHNKRCYKIEEASSISSGIFQSKEKGGRPTKGVKPFVYKVFHIEARKKRSRKPGYKVNKKNSFSVGPN